MLETMEIEWDWFPRDDLQVGVALEKAIAHMQKTGLPFCFVMKKDSVAPHKLLSMPIARNGARATAILGPAAYLSGPRPSREQVLQAVQRATTGEDLVVATTGFTGRELYACEDRSNQFYMVGSMGCASAFGLGLAFAQPNKRVVVLDGDGAVLMRMGALATLGYERRGTLVHVLLDNEVHESTGAQATVTHSVDLAGVAAACGYPSVTRVSSIEELESALRDRQPGLHFLHVKIGQGSPADLPRPKITPRQVAQQLREHIAST